MSKYFLSTLAGLLLPAAAYSQEGLIGTINLATTKGVQQIKGEWRYHEVITGVGPNKNEIEPKAHGAFDDASWEKIRPESLREARGPGKYSWCWYRLRVTIPDQVGGKPFPGGPVWFQTTVDDYGEIWVNGEIDLAPGKSGRGCVSGFNSKNRVRLQMTFESSTKGKKLRLMRDAKPGDVFQIAVLGINGPLGVPPANKIFLHGKTNLEFFSPSAPNGGEDVPATAGPPPGKEVASVNLLDKHGVELVKGKWLRHPIEFHTGPNRNEISPALQDKFDARRWESVADPASLLKPFGPGKFSMYWCRLEITLPEKIDGKAVTGTAAWFRTKVDDYAEIWVNGKIDRAGGKSGRGCISGFNTFNEVKLTDDVRPGQTYTVMVLAINGPFGNPPNNRIFFHKDSTKLRFFQEK
jgi:hypothetical protein